MKQQKGMPLVNPHASSIKLDKQLRAQLRWLKANHFRSAKEAREAGY